MMWELLKIELRYQRWRLLGTLAAVAGVLLLVAVGENDIQGLASTVFLLALVTLSANLRRERRPRYYALLPITARQVACIRLVFIGLLFAIASLAWGLPVLLSDPGLTDRTSWVWICTNGLVLSTMMLSLFYRDALNAWDPKAFWLLRLGIMAYAVVVLAATLVLVANKNTPEQSAFAAWLWHAPAFPVLCYLPAVALVYPSLATYSRRRMFDDVRGGRCASLY